VMVFLVFVDLFFESNLPFSVTVIGHKISQNFTFHFQSDGFFFSFC